MTAAVRQSLLILLCAAAGSAAAAGSTKNPQQPVQLMPSEPIARPDAQTVLGHAEKVAVMDGAKSLEIVGNLDGKEANSTLYVADMKYFVHDGDMWVSFTVDNGHVTSHEHLALQRQVMRDEHLKERGGGIQHRPWINLDLCIGKHSLPVLIALADRNAYTAQLKLGATDIDKIGRVDPALQFTVQPDCPPPAPPPAESATVAKPQ
jgi:hypothetical protein